MELSILIPCLLTALTGVLGYFIKRLISSHDALKKDFETERRAVQEAMTKIRGEYLKYEEFARFQNSIDYKLTKIYDMLVSQR